MYYIFKILSSSLIVVLLEVVLLRETVSKVSDVLHGPLVIFYVKKVKNYTEHYLLVKVIDWLLFFKIDWRSWPLNSDGPYSVSHLLCQGTFVFIVIFKDLMHSHLLPVNLSLGRRPIAAEIQIPNIQPSM